MELFTSSEYKQLLRNSQPKNSWGDHKPVVRLYIPGYEVSCLVTELNLDNPSFALCLYDFGMGSPEYGYINLETLAEFKSCFGTYLQRDPYFLSLYPISTYELAADYYQQITTNEILLREFAF